MKQDDLFATEIADGVRLTKVDFTRSGFGTPKPCIVIMSGGDDLPREDRVLPTEAAS